VLVTSLVNHRQLSKSDLSALYARRWNIALDLRNLKTTCGMDVLRCQTPQMNDKQLWVHLLAYNVVRLLMARAARYVGVEPRSLSFKHTVQLWRQWTSQGLSATTDDPQLFMLIAQCKPHQVRRGTWKPLVPPSLRWRAPSRSHVPSGVAPSRTRLLQGRNMSCWARRAERVSQSHLRVTCKVSFRATWGASSARRHRSRRRKSPPCTKAGYAPSQ